MFQITGEILSRIEPEHQPHLMHCINSLYAYGIDEMPLESLGSFLQAIVNGDLYRACAHADDINQKYIWLYCFVCHNEMPSGKVNLLHKR